MLYQSTRNSAAKVEAAAAITQGISRDAGLFVPESFPRISMDEIAAMAGEGYTDRAKRILSRYLTDFTEQEIASCVEGAYGGGKFADPKKAPLRKLDDSAFVLELWHGPTCAFKDMALQLLPYLLTVSAGKTVKDKKIVILVATSGDTGKAALEGFKDVGGTQILVFYPRDGVSVMQKLQMTTQEGENVSVCAIEGNFDDAQSGVKAIFTDREIEEKLKAHGMLFSSANSINWGRLVPQIVYYFSAYCDLLAKGELQPGDSMNVVVPTGNFGNILAAYYAKEMGLPIAKLVCASNENNILTDFIRTGTYDKNRRFVTTISPSMDILISSNLERLLYHLSGNDDRMVVSLMDALQKENQYTINDEMKGKLQKDFFAACCDDHITKQTIKQVFEQYGYLIDTHTAVAVNAYWQYIEQTGDKTKTVIASTASPYKFPVSVLSALNGGEVKTDEFEAVKTLSAKTGTQIPAPLASLGEKQVRFESACERQNMKQVVFDMLGIEA
ncbi:threonine synthase [Candidatus Soleaferrea massiliensis]|uniref:threonine synthase n=1 Tax=Candidatus Soleaferrea massiliensis TaxID=1470354 RepID=UPI00058E701E|nr:threonine synthase [Candidatus Soleaferrea massiliensis]